jgi:hypothetical protein
VKGAGAFDGDKTAYNDTARGCLGYLFWLGLSRLLGLCFFLGGGALLLLLFVGWCCRRLLWLSVFVTPLSVIFCGSSFYLMFLDSVG